MHKLIIEDDEGKQVVVPLIRDEITIGRQEGNTIRLTEQNISRRHARLVREGASISIEDLGSHTGVKVNGARIAGKTALSDGDQVLVGDYKLVVKVDAAARTVAYNDAASQQARAALSTAPPPVAAPVAAQPSTAPIGSAEATAERVAAMPASARSPVPGMPSPPRPAGPVTAPPSARTEGAPPRREPADGSGFRAPVLVPQPIAAEPPLEGQPTIPVRTLVDQGLLPGASAGPPARLVALSTQLAGSEFLLDRPSLVIGRTPENDVILNHKSISRHHAKIIREGDRYVVVDLESANGVRVNGAEQDRSELVSGDVIELGHVRLRFVTADDPYAYEPGVVRLGPLKASNGTLAMVGAGLLVAVGGVWLLARNGGSRTPPVAAVQTTTPVAPVNPPAPTSAPPAVAANEAPAAPAPAPPPQPEAPAAPAPSPAVAGALASARAALEAGRLDEAEKGTRAALAADPANVDAQELQRTVASERTGELQLATLRKKLAAADFSAADGVLANLADGTKSKSTGQRLVDSARVRYVAAHLGTAQKAQERGSCAEVRKEEELILGADPGNQKIKELSAGCKDAAATVASGGVVAKAAGRRPPASAALGGGPAAERGAAAGRPGPRASAPVLEEPLAGDPEELLNQAREAWLKGQYASAIESSKRALRIRPGLTRAYQIIAVCSCSLRDQEAAARAYDKLDDANKKLVRALCQKSGIEVGSGG